MQTRPPDLADDDVAGVISSAWEVASPTVSYLAMGYGSHHWTVEDRQGGRWFASVDALDPTGPTASLDSLASALGMAATVRAAGLDFVVAPMVSAEGALAHEIGGRYAIALYPYVAGTAGAFGDDLSPDEADELTTMLCALHAQPVAASPHGQPGVDDLSIHGRDRLTASLGTLGKPAAWTGAYGDRLRRLLSAHRDDLVHALAVHDRMVDAAGPQTHRLVPTHGEPHPGNIMHTDPGLVLIDWDTARLAPPERDVWMLAARTDGDVVWEYTTRSGRATDEILFKRYELAWALADVAAFIDALRGVPEETADTTWSHVALQATLADLAVWRAP